MITMQRLNVVRKVATEEAAAKLTGAGFTRVGGQAETMNGIASELAKFGEALLEKMKQDAAANAEGQTPVEEAAPTPPPSDGKVRKSAKNVLPIEDNKEGTPDGNGTGEPDQDGCQK